MAEPAQHQFSQAHEIASQLHVLGIKEATLMEVVKRGLTARRATTAFDPPIYAGVSAWAHMHRGLRELLHNEGWRKDDSHNFSTVVSPDGSIAIAVATGDEVTGTVGPEEPRTKYPKGTETLLAIKTNEQLSLLEPPAESENQRPRRVTWVLLVATSPDAVRFELSCPKTQDKKGYVVSWSQRIILPPLAIEPAVPPDEPGSPDIDVPVDRI